ncbi:MAG: ATP-binding protein [Anaerolineales bacterium]
MSVQSSLQSILDLRRQKEFTGREAELAFFREFLNSPPGGVGSKAIITLVGDGGVGKTWLMRQMKQIASNTGVPTTFCDEKQIDLLAAMAHMADQLEQNDIKLKKFSARYKVYRQKMNQIEADPDTPQGLVALLGKTAVQATFVWKIFSAGSQNTRKLSYFWIPMRRLVNTWIPGCGTCLPVGTLAGQKTLAWSSPDKKV